MSQRSPSTIISEGTIFIRDNTPGTKGSAPVAVLAVLPRESIQADGHYLLSFEKADEGKLVLSENQGLSMMMQHRIEEGSSESFEDLGLNEIFRQEFVMIAAGHPASHGYARHVASGEDLADTCVVLASCIRRDVAKHLGLHSEHIYRLDGQSPLRENGKDMTLAVRGSEIGSLVTREAFRLADDSLPHSGNPAEQDRRLRAFYLELAEMGPESTLQERDELYAKHCGDDWIGRSHYKEDDFVAYIQYRYRDGMPSKEAVLEAKQRSENGVVPDDPSP